MVGLGGLVWAVVAVVGVDGNLAEAAHARGLRDGLALDLAPVEGAVGRPSDLVTLLLLGLSCLCLLKRRLVVEIIRGLLLGRILGERLPISLWLIEKHIFFNQLPAFSGIFKCRPKFAVGGI